MLTYSSDPYFKKINFKFREGNSGNNRVEFRLSLTDQFIRQLEIWQSIVGVVSVRVNYTTVNSTAKSGRDYLSTSGSFTINSIDEARRGRNIRVYILGDRQVERDERFFLDLSTTIEETGNDYYQRITGIIENDDRRNSSLNVTNDVQIESKEDLLLGNRATLVGNPNFQEVKQIRQNSENLIQKYLANIDYDTNPGSINLMNQPERWLEPFPIAFGDDSPYIIV